MGDCPFCKIGAGREDTDLVALRTPTVFVLPVPQQRPRNRGHVLVLPVAHVTRLADADAELLHQVYATAGRVSEAVRRAFGASGATIFQNESAPDQVLHHLHVHVVPRHADDRFRMPDPDKVEVSREERRQQAAALRAALGV